MTTASNVSPFQIRTERATDTQKPIHSDTGIFTQKADGIYFEEYGKNGQTLPEKRICAALCVLAETRTPHGNGWGKLLEWRDDDNRLQRWAMPRKLLSGDSAEIASELLDRGLDILPNKKNKVVEYIHASRPFHKITCTDKTGWHGGAYVTPDKVYGQEAGEYIYQTEGAAIDPIFSIRSTLADWKREVAAYAGGNSRLLFALSAAFAGTLATPANLESGGFHIVGGSSSGKSTAQRVAASVWGDPETFKRSWRATSNGLEGVASLHNDNILILDEISEMNPKDASETAYMLGNGQGKTRSSKTGNTRQAKTWKTLFLSSGEVTLQDMINEEGGGRRRTKAGQEVRIANIQADAGKGMGLFEHLHTFGKPSSLADHLRYQTSKHHGAAGAAWLDAVTKNHRELWDTLPAEINAFCNGVLPKDAGGQAHRVARRFGLVAVAGELATRYQLTGWKAGEATAAAQRCFHDWLKLFGTGNREDKQIIDTVLGFLERNGARFQNMTFTNPLPVPDQVGFVRPCSDGHGTLEYIIPARQMPRVAEGYNLNQAIAILQEHGLINEPDKEGKNAIKVRLPSMGVQRCYIITPDRVEHSEA